MSEPAQLTRERLDEALYRFRNGSWNASHRRVVFAAAERLLAMRPASDEELSGVLASGWLVPGDMTPDERAKAELIYRAAERRLLPFADEPAREGNEP